MDSGNMAMVIGKRNRPSRPLEESLQRNEKRIGERDGESLEQLGCTSNVEDQRCQTSRNFHATPVLTRWCRRLTVSLLGETKNL